MNNQGGFSQETFRFLSQLKANNNRSWFNDNKARYEACVREPALGFIREMGAGLEGLSPHFRAVAKKSGGSLMRVYRDIRFSSDKTPYKTNIGIHFRHEQGKDVHAPGFYLHIEPGNSFLGVGIWHPESKTLTRIREFLMDNPAAWKKAKTHRPFKSNYLLEGESLKRPPRGFPTEHELIEDLKRKDFIARKPLKDEQIINGRLVRTTVNGFRQAEPLMIYLCTAVGVPY